MCLGLPMQVVGEAGPGHALCRYRGEDQVIDMALVGQVPVGGWVMTFLGAAREVMDEASASRSLAALTALEAIMAGEHADIDAAFPDLVRTDAQPSALN